MFTYADITCIHPPAKPSGGTRKWDGKSNFGNQIRHVASSKQKVQNMTPTSASCIHRYTCGPYAKFGRNGTEELYNEAVIGCQWNRSWTMTELDKCVCKKYVLATRSKVERIFIAMTHCTSLGSYCPIVPEPPEDRNLVFDTPEASSLLVLSSKTMTKYLVVGI